MEIENGVLTDKTWILPISLKKNI